MTVDAVRAGYRVGEYELDLSHRATGRTFAGFLHRGRQLLDFVAPTAPALRAYPGRVERLALFSGVAPGASPPTNFEKS